MRDNYWRPAGINELSRIITEIEGVDSGEQGFHNESSRTEIGKFVLLKLIVGCRV